MGARTDEAIYAAHAHELTVFARSLVGVDDAADVVSEAVVAALGTAGWTTVQNPRAYLYRAVFNRAQSHLRKQGARRSVERRAFPRSGLVDSGFTGETDPAILEAVEQLSTQQRAVIALTYWRDLPVAEVATLLGISDGSVRKHLARARAHLREVLHDQR